MSNDKEYAHEWYEKHKHDSKFIERRRESAQAYYHRTKLLNADKLKERSKRRYARSVATPEKRAATALKQKINNKRWQAAHPEEAARQLERAQIRKYGISNIDFWNIVAVQGNKCKACERPFDGSRKLMHIDHCHKTKKVRGILCRWCNNSLGLLKEDPKLIRALAVYAETYCTINPGDTNEEDNISRLDHAQSPRLQLVQQEASSNGGSMASLPDPAAAEIKRA